MPRRLPVRRPAPPIQGHPAVEGNGNRILVDGSNVAHEVMKQDAPTLEGLWLVEDRLKDLGFRPLIIVDASLRWKLVPADMKELERRRREIVQAPAGVPADLTLLEYADRLGLKVVTNDRYRDWEVRYPWVRDRKRIIRYNVIGDEVLLYFDSVQGRRPPAAPVRQRPRVKKAAPRPAAPRVRARPPRPATRAKAARRTPKPRTLPPRQSPARLPP